MVPEVFQTLRVKLSFGTSLSWNKKDSFVACKVAMEGNVAAVGRPGGRTVNAPAGGEPQNSFRVDCLYVNVPIGFFISVPRKSNLIAVR